MRKSTPLGQRPSQRHGDADRRTGNGWRLAGKIGAAVAVPIALNILWMAYQAGVISAQTEARDQTVAGLVVTVNRLSDVLGKINETLARGDQRLIALERMELRRGSP